MVISQSRNRAVAGVGLGCKSIEILHNNMGMTTKGIVSGILTIAIT